jgi:hypothetical protein
MVAKMAASAQIRLIGESREQVEEAVSFLKRVVESADGMLAITGSRPGRGGEGYLAYGVCSTPAKPQRVDTGTGEILE